jgi:hypothetical protein
LFTFARTGVKYSYIDSFLPVAFLGLFDYRFNAQTTPAVDYLRLIYWSISIWSRGIPKTKVKDGLFMSLLSLLRATLQTRLFIS